MNSDLELRLRLRRGAFALDVALDAPSPGVTALFGPSGSGKSTLLRCLAGLEPDAQGRIALGGQIWLDSERGVHTPTHRRGVGLVFQDAALFPHLDVRGNLEFGLRRAASERRALGFDDAVHGLGLGALLGRGIAGLSGGERQRVAIARALLAGPRLLLLDEPLAALDAAARAEILDLLRELLRASPIPVLYVTHTRSEAVQLADHLVLLAAGRVRASGPLREVALGPEGASFGGPEELGTVLEAQVESIDDRGGISLLRFAGGRLAVPGLLAPGETRRLEIRARDVSLALDPPGRSSILNVLQGQVCEVRDAAAQQPVVAIEVGRTRLLARISRRSLEQLGIEPRLTVYAQIKAIAVSP